MAAFVIDLLDSSNNPIGDGPLTSVLAVSIQEKLDESGAIAFTVPATDRRVATLLEQAARFRVRLGSGTQMVYGLIDKDALDATADQPNRTVQGGDLLREFQRYSMGWWCFFDDQDLNTVVLPKLVQDTGWTLGTVDAALGTIYYRFDGDSRLAALIKLAAATGKHFRLGATFRSLDFGAFGSAAVYTFTNVATALKQYDPGDARAHDWQYQEIIGALQVTSDRAPVVNRIIPWGAGSDGGDTNRAKVSLFHLTPGDSRWSEIKCKPGVRGATATISSVGTEDGKPSQYFVDSSAGFFAEPVTQVFWCYDPDDLTLGCGYDFVIRAVHETYLNVRGSPTLPDPPDHFPAYLISNPQLYIEDPTEFAADPHEAVVIFSDVTLTDLSLGAFESAASQLYERAKQYVHTHKTPQLSYAVSVFNCPEDLHVGDRVHITYSGAVTRGGATVSWVDVDTDLFVVNITRTFNADGSTNAVVEVSDIAQQPIDSAGAIANSAGTVGTHAVTVGIASIGSGGGAVESGSSGNPLTFALPLVRTIDHVTLPLTNSHLLVGSAGNVPTDVALSGDATLANTGALALATVNSNVGSFKRANLTVNAKGLVTAAAGSPDRIFNVMDYGAAGDGTTDDTDAIADCIAAALAANGAVYFPAGYRFGVSNINFPNGIRQVFGKGVVVDGYSDGSADALVTLGGVNCLTGTAEAVEYLDLSMSIEVGQNATLRALACASLVYSSIHDCSISWGTLRTDECYGIDLRWITAENTVTANVTIANNRIVAQVFSSYSYRFSAIALVGNSTAYGGYFANGDGSVTDPTLPVRNVIITGNTITGGSHGITLNGCQNITVTGNTLYAQKHRGIVCEPVTSRCVISGNTIRDFGSSAVLLGYGCAYNTISGNTCYTLDETGEGAIQAYIGCRHNLISGNNIHAFTNYGIYLAVVALYNVVSGNHVTGYRLAGIAIENDWTDPLPTGADFSRPNFGAPPSPYTNWALGHTQGNVVSGNYIGDPRSSPDGACAISLAQLNGYDGTTKTYCYLNEISGNIVQPYMTLGYDVFVFEEESGYCVHNTLANNLLYAVTAAKVGWTRSRSHFRICSGNEGINVPTDVPGGSGVPFVDLTAGDTTPDVSFGDAFATANTGSTTITAFDNGAWSQEFLLRLDANTGITHNVSYIILKGAASIAPGSASTACLMRFKMINTVWFELWRNW